MIPKIIHYVWVGSNPKSALFYKCIKSWKKYCPDYEIREWSNSDLLTINNLYVKQAVECKKWAFVSDYIRLFALYNLGGFYFDTDLELTSSLENFRTHDFVSGFEKHNETFSPITSACMGAKKHNEIIFDLLNEYENIQFISNQKMDLTTNTIRITRYFKNKFNINPPYNGYQTLKLDTNSFIYPSYYFCYPEKNFENFAIHHFCASWFDNYKRKHYCKIGKYKLVRFKKIYNKGNNELPLTAKERKILSISINTKKIYCLLKEDNIPL